MMKEERLFSGIYIAGTALAIAFTMVMAVERPEGASWGCSSQKVLC